MTYFRTSSVLAIAGTLAMSTLVGGCKKTADNKINYESAINTYYSTRPVCLWPEAKKFPVQMGHDSDDTAKFDALVDQGLLTRTTSEKKIIIISKQQNNYDVSEKGRAAWAADTSMPGYGNFCYGKPKVSSIVSSTPTSDQPGATTTVQYQYALDGVPDWARAAETQNTYPSVASHLAAAKSGTAVLTNTSNGWQVTSVQ